MVVSKDNQNHATFQSTLRLRYDLKMSVDQRFPFGNYTKLAICLMELVLDIHLYIFIMFDYLRLNFSA